MTNNKPEYEIKLGRFNPEQLVCFSDAYGKKFLSISIQYDNSSWFQSFPPIISNNESSIDDALKRLLQIMHVNNTEELKSKEVYVISHESQIYGIINKNTFEIFSLISFLAIEQDKFQKKIKASSDIKLINGLTDFEKLDLITILETLDKDDLNNLESELKIFYKSFVKKQLLKEKIDVEIPLHDEPNYLLNKI